MSSEGEFKRRIKEWWDSDYHEDLSIEYPESSSLPEKKNAPIAVIEDAKKEFWQTIDNLCNIENLHSTDAINKMTDVILKWFGDSEK